MPDQTVDRPVPRRRPFIATISVAGLAAASVVVTRRHPTGPATATLSVSGGPGGGATVMFVDTPADIRQMLTDALTQLDATEASR